MIPGTLAKRYARALFGLSESSIDRDRYLRDLEAFVTAIRTDADSAGTEALDLLSARHVATSIRLGIVDALAKHLTTDDKVLRFIRLIVERGRASGLPQIALQYRDMVDASVGRVRATLTSALPLSADASGRVKKALEDATRKHVLMETKVDPELIGGLVVHVDSFTIDRSVRRSLDQLRGELVRG